MTITVYALGLTTYCFFIKRINLLTLKFILELILNSMTKIYHFSSDDNATNN